MKVYVGATRQNDGKTIASLGLISGLQKRVGSVGYMKPVGQRYVEIDSHQIDEDALLVKDVYDLKGSITDMSPIAVPRHFTENYIDNPDRERLVKKVTESFERVAAGKDVVVEGTGHAGVGSVFDMSNGDVAALLGCRAVIVTSGGVGRPIDEIMLNKAMFDAAGVEIVGVIVNKVQEEKYEKIKSYVTRGLQRKGLDVLGVMPYRPMLSSPTLEQLVRDIGGELLCGEERELRNTVGKVVVGAMSPHQALEYMTGESLLITPGTREDLILAAMSLRMMPGSENSCVAGMILTGGIPPQPNIMTLIKKMHIPTILVRQDTFTTATKIGQLIVKIRPGDFEKIREAEELVNQYVDIDRLLDRIR